MYPSYFMTLWYFNIMLLFIMFLVCSSYMLDIVMIDDEYMLFAKRLGQYSSELSGRHYVSVALKYCLPTDALYTLGHVVDRRCDTPVESFVVHSPFV